MEKKGELTTQQLVIIIILIASFVILLIFLFNLNLKETTNSQICHNSVVMKSNSGLTKDVVSLNCHREYVCITKDGSCDKLNNAQKIKVESLEEIYQVLADEMANCWWMFGEGEIDYIGSGATKNNHCSICSQIAFEDNLKEIKDGTGTLVLSGGKISKDELYDYLSKTKMEGKETTYAEYLLGTNDVNGIKQEAYNTKGIDTFGKIDIENQYFVIMGITNTVGHTWKILQGVGIAVSVASLFTPAGAVTIVFFTGAAIVGGATAGAALLTSEPEIGGIIIPGKGIENNFMVPTIQEADSDKFKALNCEDIITFS